MWSDVPCKLWTGKPGADGYGRTTRTVNGIKTAWLVHRLVWVEANGPIPEGVFVCHHCDNRACYEVTHLFLGTHQDNMDDMWVKGRGATGARKTHCPRGHEYTPENTHVRPPTDKRDTLSRVCLACNRERCKRYSKVRATKRPSRAKR